MKKNLLLGAAAALCFGGTAIAATPGYAHSDVYIQFAKPSESLRGAMGPVRHMESAATSEFGSGQRYEGDLYDSYRLPAQTLRGAMGPIRTEVPADVAASEAWWQETKHRARILGDND